MGAGSVPEIERISGQLNEPERPRARDEATAYTSTQWTGALTLAEPFSELTQRFGPLCANAVDPFEIAAGLEMDGLSDQATRVRYGVPDVFALAEELFRVTRRQPAEPTAAPNPWRTTIGKHVLHGALFALPALCYPVASSLMADRGALLLLVISMLVSWPASQGLSYLGHSRRSRRDLDGSRWLLRAGLGVFGLVLVAAVVLTATLTGEPTAIRAFAAGQGGYLLAATVLLVAGAELWLCIALAPAVLVSAVYLLPGQPWRCISPAWLSLGRDPAAGRRTSRCGRPVGRGRNRLAGWSASGNCGCRTLCAFGLLVIGLLVFPLVAPRLFPVSRRRGHDDLLGTLPLSLSMGAAELQLYRYRGRIFGCCTVTGRLEEFAGRSRWCWPARSANTSVAAAVLMAAVIGLARLAGLSPHWSDVPDYAGYLALGGALFLALLTQTCAGTAACSSVRAGARRGVRCWRSPIRRRSPCASSCSARPGCSPRCSPTAVLVLGKANKHSQCRRQERN